MKQTVDDKKISGVVTILARHGKVVDYWSYGQRDLASGAPMTRDTISRDYSMTKPITGVAMMTLYEQGKWRPSDPISKFIPEFEHLKVFNGFDVAGKMILADPDHAPTMVDLMTHGRLHLRIPGQHSCGSNVFGRQNTQRKNSSGFHRPTCQVATRASAGHNMELQRLHGH